VENIVESKESHIDLWFQGSDDTMSSKHTGVVAEI
jgi:hypothetical protein